MPYLHCPSCRLTIYKPRDLVRYPEHCPRCEASLSRKPGRLFRTLPPRPGVADDPRHAAGSGSRLPPIASRTRRARYEQRRAG